MNIRRLAFVMLAAVVSIAAEAQTEIFLKAAGTQGPVEYATIHAEGKVWYSDTNGHVTFTDVISSVRVSHICYLDTVVRITPLKENVIALMPREFSLPEVVVGRRTKHKLHLVGTMQKKQHLYFGGRSGEIIAVYLPYKEEYIGKTINSIVADLYESKLLRGAGYDEVEKAVLRFDLRLPDVKRRMPSGISLIGGGILYEGKGNGRETISLDYPIAFPKEGIFVLAEWIVAGECKPNVIYNPHIRMSKSALPSNSWIKREYNAEDWVNWDNDAGMRQMQATAHGNAVEANLGLLIEE